MTNKGFTAEIYRSTFKDSLSKFKGINHVTIIDEAVPKMYEPTEDAPGVKIVRRFLFGSEYIHAEPVDPGSYAASGSFIYCSDSRFGDLSPYPIPLHDRQMNLER